MIAKHHRGGHIIQNGFLGRLTCLFRMRVRPGEKVMGSIRGITRMADLVRPLTTDINQVMVAFYIPHRWRLPSWDQYIKEGPGANIDPRFPNQTQRGYSLAMESFLYRRTVTLTFSSGNTWSYSSIQSFSRALTNSELVETEAASAQNNFIARRVEYTRIQTDTSNAGLNEEAFRGLGTRQRVDRVGLHEALIPYLISYHHLADYPDERFPTGHRIFDVNTQQRWKDLFNLENNRQAESRPFNENSINHIIAAPGVRPGSLGAGSGLQMMALPNDFTRLYEEEELPRNRNIFAESSTTEIDLHKLSVSIANYNSELDRAKRANRYDEIIKNFWKVMPTEESTYKPVVIGRESSWISGIDINGTAEQNLGHSAGKAIGFREMKIKQFMAPEHGDILIYTGIRVPTLWAGEKFLPDDVVDFSGVSEGQFMERTGEQVDKLPLVVSNVNYWFGPGSRSDAGRFMHEPDFQLTKGSNFVNRDFIERETAHIPEGDAPEVLIDLKRGLASADTTILDSSNTKGKIFASTPQREWTFAGYADINTEIYQKEPSSEFSKIGEDF